MASAPELPVLRGERVIVRPVEERDVEALAAILAEPEVARWWGRFDEARLRKTIAGENVTAWTVELGGETIGLVVTTEEPDPEERHVDLDVFLSSAHHGGGLGTDALRTALRHMFEDRGHHRAVLYTNPANERAIRCYSRLGFQRVGVLRKAARQGDGPWEDELLLDLLAPELRLAGGAQPDR